MIAALDIGLRASLVMFSALAATTVLRRRPAAIRYWVLAAGIFSAATVAPLGTFLPEWDLPQPPSAFEQAINSISSTSPPRAIDNSASTTSNVKATAPAPRISVETLVNVAWASGFFFAFALLMTSLLRLGRVTTRAVAVTDPRWLDRCRELRTRLLMVRDVAILRTDRPDMLGTWGWRRPCILLPEGCETWNDERIRIVLGHEMAHIARSDWAIQVLAELVRAVFWYNPLFWIASNRLRRESEQACDEAVLDAGVPPAEYASHLLDLARQCRPRAGGAAIVPIARPSTLEWRIAAMLNTTLVRHRPSRQALTIAFAVIVGITLTTSSFRAAARVQPAPLTGTVYDTSGAVLPQVALTLENPDGTKQTATSDSLGRFDFGEIAPGRYLLTSALMGFASITQAVPLQDPRNWERAITLQIGTLQETITVKDQRPAMLSPVTATPVRIGGNLRAPTKLVDKRPVYPQAVRDAGLEGTVPLGAVIGVDGSVLSVRVLSSNAHPDLAKSAMDAVRQWRFTPTLLNGAPVEVFMSVSVTFKLDD